MSKKLRLLLRPYVPMFVAALALVFILSGVTTLATQYIRTATDTVLAGESVQLQPLILLLAGLLLCGVIASYLSSIFFMRFSVYSARGIKNAIADKVRRLPYLYFDEKGSGAIIARVTGDINESQYMLRTILPTVCRTTILIICYMAYLFYLDVRLTLVSMIIFPVILLLVSLVSRRLVALTKKSRSVIDDIAGAVGDIMGGMYVEKSYNLQDEIDKKLDSMVDDALKPDLDKQKIMAPYAVIWHISRWLPLFICCIYGAYTAFEGDMSAGTLVAFVILLGNVSGPLSELPGEIMEMRQLAVSLERLGEILELPEEKGGSFVDAPESDIAVNFSGVNFRYREDAPVLHDVNFTVSKGANIAIVGASGCGKTTVFKLLCGFYAPTEGTYEINGAAFGSWDLDCAREQIALVSQDVFLFPTTIRENIAFGRPSATQDEIEAAAKSAGIHDFIVGLPDGYDSLVGERGIRISGGERQRVSIARAILKNAPILLLDEPTAALDMASEGIVQEALAKLGRDRTVITIAHRLSTIRNADEILVMENGRIVERGTHDSLITGGVYAALYQKQEEEATA